MTVNTRISNIVSSQLPGFVRDDNPLFVSFMEAYFEYLEQDVGDTGSTGTGKVVERLKNLKNYNSIERTLDDFAAQLYSQFIKFIPQNVPSSSVDLKKLLPHIKDFYRAKGTEKSYKFLLRLLSGGSESSIFYPKDHILRASDGKWFIQKSLRVEDVQLDGNADPSLSTFTIFTSKQLQGQSSNSVAVVERVEQYYELGELINEIFISSISNTFTSGETVQSTYIDTSNTSHTIRANIFSGIVTRITVTDPGSGYTIGAPVPLISQDSGSGATAYISDVTSGNVTGVGVIAGGSGYRASDMLLFTGGGGSGANGNVLTVNTSGVFHPNSYLIDGNSLVQIAGANWNAAQAIFSISTSNLASNTINTLATYFLYANTGPVISALVSEAGDGYVSPPDISVIPNTVIASLGVLGSLIINSGGLGYSVGDNLTFTTPIGSYGFGAAANVVSVAANGMITGVRYKPVTGLVTGGSGYSQDALPTVEVANVSASGANIAVVSLLGFGAELEPSTGTIGAIESIEVQSGGAGYTIAPTVDLANMGDGTANAVAAVVQGVYSYPGYFLNQDGFPSAFNFLQDRDYYQNYSYVVRARLTFDKWVQAVSDLLHPSGLKVFGEYLLLDDTNVQNANVDGQGFEAQERLEQFDSQFITSYSTYYDGSSYIRTMSESYGGNAGLGGILWSGWVLFPTYLSNTSHEMTLMEASLSNTTPVGRAVVSIANSANIESGTGHYFNLRVANNNGQIILNVKSDEIKNPLQANVWYHLIVAANTRSGQNGLWVSNVNSTITLVATTDTSANMQWHQMNIVTFGANTQGGNTFTGYMADVWWSRFSGYYGIENWTARNDWLEPPLFPNANLGANGIGWAFPSQPVHYMRGNSAIGNTNSGYGQKNFGVTGTVIGLQSGPRQAV